MEQIKNIFARIWAFWGLLSFSITLCIVFFPVIICYLIPGKAGQSYFIFVSRLWMNVWLFLIGCPLSVRGKENFKKGETYVIVFNHNALLDVPLSSPYVPGANKTIAKKSFAKIPLFGWLYKKGSVLVDRKDPKSRVKSFEEMKQVLQSGIHMSIYPEGTRNRTKEPLKNFYDGAFRLAISAGKDVIPCIIKGTKRAMPVHKTFYLLPGKLSLEFLPPVSSKNTSINELKEKVYRIMVERYVG